MTARTRVALAVLISAWSAARAFLVGANVGGSSYWSDQAIFCDLIKQSQYPFGSVRAPYDHAANCSAVKCDARGWPVGEYGIWIWEMESAEDAGVFQLTANGNAAVETWEFGRLLNQRYDPATNVFTAEINATAGRKGSILDLRISNVSTPGGFVNVSLWNPRCGAAAGTPAAAGAGASGKPWFHPNYIKLLQSFSGPLRTMSAVGATDSGQTDWSTRHPVTAPTWTTNPAIPCTVSSHGQTECDGNVPWEVLIGLANEAGRDIWVNVPPNATDEYVSSLAALLKSSLDPSLAVYVEWANEVWNWMFPVAHWNLQAAIQEVKDGDAGRLNYDSCNKQGYWAWRRVAWKLLQVLKPFKAVFGADAGARVRGVYASQIGSGEGASNCCGGPAAEALRYVSAVYGRPGDHLSVLAGAPYFGLGPETGWANLTEAMVLDTSREVIAAMIPDAGNNFTRSHVVGFSALARWYGLTFAGYEGGPDYSGKLVDPGANRSIAQKNINAKMDARLSTQMRPLILSYLTGLQAAGMEWLEFFGAFVGSFNSTITFSVIQDVNDDLASYTMLSGIKDAVAAPRPPLAAGVPARGAWGLPEMQLALKGAATGSCSSCGKLGPCMRCLPVSPAKGAAEPLGNGDGSVWVANSGAPKGGDVTVRLNMTSTAPIDLAWWLNGQAVATVTMPNASLPTLSPPVTLSFSEAMAVVGVSYANLTAHPDFAVFSVNWEAAR